MTVKRLCLLAISALMLGSPAYGAKMHGPVRKEEAPRVLGPKIRVLLAKNVNSALVEAKGAYRVIQRKGGVILSGGLVGKRYVMHSIQDGIRWGEEFPGVTHLTIVPANRETSFFVNGFQYCGVLDVYADQNHMITVVNEVPIEDYVRSTVALQVTGKMNPEALAAYIIAARTEAYAISLSGKDGDRNWDVRARDVGYFGNGVALQRNGVDDGVEATRFMVLESTKAHLPEPVRIFPGKLEELANNGLDAKEMLKKCFPQTSLNVTADPTARVIR